ncbi:MAG TPA: hypothetical protein VGR61_07800 [Candidatus Dormibacteraeota bacterium]|nr:hypothetical protein [Candidatus Dormibacteraeota bacterium]
MTLDLGRLVGRAFAISWHHRWLWFLGVFGGVGVGLNLNPGVGGNFGSRRGAGQFGQFLSDHVALIVGAAALLVAIALVAFVVSCVAVPASIWATLELDAGREVRLGAAWRAGRSRFWRYLRLALLKSLIGMVVIALAGLLVALGFGAYRAGGDATLPLLVLGAVLLAFLMIALLVVVGLGLTWSDRLLVILELGAVDSIRAGWWLFKRSKLDTIVLGIVFYVVRLMISIGIALVAGLVSIPGILMVVSYFATQQAAVGLMIAGIVWIVVLGGAVELVGAGFTGALYQAGYAMAARDLSFSRGLQEVLA